MGGISSLASRSSALGLQSMPDTDLDQTLWEAQMQGIPCDSVCRGWPERAQSEAENRSGRPSRKCPWEWSRSRVFAGYDGRRVPQCPWKVSDASAEPPRLSDGPDLTLQLTRYVPVHMHATAAGRCSPVTAPAFAGSMVLLISAQPSECLSYLCLWAANSLQRLISLPPRGNTMTCSLFSCHGLYLVNSYLLTHLVMCLLSLSL